VRVRNFGAARVEESGARFILTTGNHLFHSGRSSMKSETLLGLLKGAVVEISEEDARSLGLNNGDKVSERARTSRHR
jgi:anaerobic selenocysteine-containing dehydrogenase